MTYNMAVIERIQCSLIPDSEKHRLLENLCKYWRVCPDRCFTEEGYDYFCKKLNQLEKEYSDILKNDNT